jgi:hypothetical protein
MDDQKQTVGAVDKALCAIRRSPKPLEALARAIDIVVAAEGFYTNAERERLLSRLLVVRAVVETDLAGHDGLLDEGFTALEALLLSRTVPEEGAAFELEYADPRADDFEPLTWEDRDCGDRIDILAAGLRPMALAKLKMVRSGLQHVLDAREVIGCGPAYDRAWSRYMVAAAKDELRRRSDAKRKAENAALAEKERKYYHELGEIAAAAAAEWEAA